MSVGQQLQAAQIDNRITNLTSSLREVMHQIQDFTTQVNTLGTAGLEAAGYSPTDAATVQTVASYLSTFPLVYNGVQFQGTTGTNGIQFNFNNALSGYWAGQ
jgi:hypothetical protein